MLIHSYDSTAFGVNLHSPKLKYRKKDFYVRIKGYGKNPLWAFKTIKTADEAVKLIRNDTPAENVLKFITTGITKANQFCMESYKRKHTGLLRASRKGWDQEAFYADLVTGYGIKTKYTSYKERFDKVYNEKPLTEPRNDIGMTRPSRFGLLKNGKPEFINSSLNYIFELCSKIFPKFIHQEVQQENLKDINKTIAEIRWILAHATPWSRGSDAISNVFIRAIYKAIGIKTYPLKKGFSLDLEAYCTQLSEYKGRFSKYFEKPPEIIE